MQFDAIIEANPLPNGKGQGVLCSKDLLDVRLSAQTSLFKDGRLLVWFSCGAASACALKLVAHLNPLAIYCDLSKNENADNVRFRAEVEQWTGIKVTVIKSKLYDTVEEVFEARQYMSGPAGAPCTVEMKKVPRFDFQRADDTHIFGMTTDEASRIRKFESNNCDMNLAWPLVNSRMSKADCLEMLMDAGIILPTMYRLGYSNNNCEGCVKASSARYWNLVRKTSPEVFRRRCEQSRRLGCKLVRWKGERIYLDELPEEADDQITEQISCGPDCGESRTPNDGAMPRRQTEK
jgi:hypothetical protein